MGAEVFAVDGIHRGEVAHALEEHGGFDDVLQCQPLGIEDGFDVGKYLMRLRFDCVADNFAIFRRKRKLARAEQKVALTDSVRIGADGSGCFGCVDDFHAIGLWGDGAIVNAAPVPNSGDESSVTATIELESASSVKNC